MSGVQKWTTGALTADLAARLRSDGLLVVAEVTLRDLTGQRADLLAMPRRLHHGPMLIFVIKVSRADLLADLRAAKWRGYLADGAVAFAIPAGLADPKEIPTEAGLIILHGDVWRWKRGPRWRGAPLPTNYLYRRMALSAADQYGAMVRQQMTPRSADLWQAARGQRQVNGRRLAVLAAELDVYEQMLRTQKEKWSALEDQALKLRSEVSELELQAHRLRREVAA